MEELKLHIGGKHAKEGWKILNIMPGMHVDIVGNCVDMPFIESASVSEIYASHVLEHLGFREELPQALAEFNRVLRPGGLLRISVPDFEAIIHLYVKKAKTFSDRWMLLTMLYGGQKNAYDFHKFGATWELMQRWLSSAGFTDIRRIKVHGLFPDASELRRHGEYISLNVTCRK